MRIWTAWSAFPSTPLDRPPGAGGKGFPFPSFLDYRQNDSVFSDMEGGTGIPALHWTHDNQTTQWTDIDLNAGGYQFFGVKPLIGRLITPADTKLGAQPVFMMAYKVWKDQFNGDPKIVGKIFNLDGTPWKLIAKREPVEIADGNGRCHQKGEIPSSRHQSGLPARSPALETVV